MRRTAHLIVGVVISGSGCLSDGGGGLRQVDVETFDTLETSGGETGGGADGADVGGDAPEVVEVVDDAGADGAGDTGTLADTDVVDTVPGDTGGPVDTVADTVTDTDTATNDADTAQPAPDPAVRGPFAVSASDVTVAGFAARWFVPTVVGRVPAVVLAPGFTLDAATLGWLADHLASHGFAVLLVEFGDSPFSPLTHSALAEAMREALTWMAARPEVDAAKLAVGGHSRGGKAAMLAAARDSRVRAVLGLDPVDAPPPLTQPNGDYPSVTPELMGQVRAALLLLGSEYGATSVVFGAPECAPAADNYAQYAANASAASRVVVEEIDRSGHNDFADPLSGLAAGACKAGDSPAATRARAKLLAVAFLAVVLKGDGRYEAWLSP